MNKRTDDFQEQAEKYAEEVWKDDADIEQKCLSMTDYFAGAEYGYQYARKNLWYDADGDYVPEYDREVIVIGRDGKVFFGHRPNPKEVTMVEGEAYLAKTYDKNGWNWPDIALWLDVEVPEELIDEIINKYFEEHEQLPRKEE